MNVRIFSSSWPFGLAILIVALMAPAIGHARDGGPDASAATTTATTTTTTGGRVDAGPAPARRPSPTPAEQPSSPTDPTAPATPSPGTSAPAGKAPEATTSPAPRPGDGNGGSAGGEGDAGSSDFRSPTDSDAGAGDAGPVDAGASDAGPPGAESADAGLADAGLADAGPGATNELPAPEAARPVPKGSAGIIIRVIIGLSILLIFAYAGSHPMILALEARIGIAHVVTAGFPFVLLGLIASQNAVGVLTDDILATITPILNFGLGWLGFIIGLQMDLRHFDRLPQGTGLLVVVEASVPFIVITLACGALMVLFGQDYRDPSVIRNAVMLGAAGAMTGLLRDRSLGGRSWVRKPLERGNPKDIGLQSLVSQLDEVFGLVALLVLAAYFRPTEAGTTWQLPGTAWVFVTLGLGVAVGMLLFVMVRKPQSGAEFLAVLFGFIAFASGLAGYLSLSPIVVCFIAGALVTNFPCEQRDRVAQLSNRMERPIHLIFLIIAGALWSVDDWRGWVLLPCFVASRFVGRYLGIFAGQKSFEAKDQVPPDHGPVVTPLSVLSIALVVNVERLYVGEDGGVISWVMTAVIGGAFVTEFFVQLIHEGFRPPATDPMFTKDGAYEGPTYRGIDSGSPDRESEPES